MGRYRGCLAALALAAALGGCEEQFQYVGKWEGHFGPVGKVIELRADGTVCDAGRMQPIVDQGWKLQGDYAVIYCTMATPAGLLGPGKSVGQIIATLTPVDHDHLVYATVGGLVHITITATRVGDVAP
jgi:hypothetical protein